MNKYLQDINFLKTICNYQTQETFCRVSLLDSNENIIDNLTGIIQSGNINLDGTSSIRRTCSLSILLKNLKYANINWVLENKIKIEIGIKNITNKFLEDEIIWFPMGIFYLTNFSLSQNAQGISINIQGKDKMIKLTGDLGGIFNSSIDFSNIEIHDSKTNTLIKNKLKIKDIIVEMIHTYGFEPYEKIFIYDLDDYALNTISYCGEEPIYIFLIEENNQIVVVNYMFDKTYKIKTKDGNIMSLEEIEDKDFFVSKQTLLNDMPDLKKFTLLENDIDDTEYYIRKCKSGEIVGYELTELVYPNDLIAAPGENVTSILNKIINILGNDIYEYYYDLDGNFIFKKKDHFIQIESYLNPYVSFVKPSISFFNNELICDTSESFDLSKIKNDFTVWGTKNNSDIQFHARIAIDKKPKQYISINITEEEEKKLKEQYPNLYTEEMKLEQISQCYSVNDFDSNIWDDLTTWKKVDWREIIYQMAQDYKKFNQISNFYEIIENNNPEYLNGITGYERYYIDLDGFWRQLYMPEPAEVKIDEYLSEDNFYTIDLSEPIVYFKEEDLADPKNTIKRKVKKQDGLGVEEKLKDKEYDIKSSSLENQIVYKQTFDKDNIPTYTAVGDLNSIIATNYKILQKMYFCSNRHNDNDYLISEDIDTKEIRIWNAKNQSLLWLINCDIDLTQEAGQDKFNYINNKNWKYLQENNLEPEELGTYYDITTLYIQKNQKVKYGSSIENFEKINSFSITNSSTEYIKISDYPKNKNNDDLTNIQHFDLDVPGLILWAQANNQLSYIDKNINQITHFNNDIYNNPSNLIFWFDFLDNMTFSQAQNIQVIGPREYVSSKSNATSIINLFILNDIFLNYNKKYTKDEEAIKKFYKTPFAQKRKEIPFFRMAKKDNRIFKMAQNSTSALDIIYNYIQNNNYMATKINLKSISQYYLQPNSLFEIINIEDKKILQYIIDKISFSFGTTPNRQMTISGIKIMDQDYVYQDLRKEIIDE